MNKIIIYGLYSVELRRKVEHFLSDDFEIIGYSDTYLKTDILDNKKYIYIDRIDRLYCFIIKRW